MSGPLRFGVALLFLLAARALAFGYEKDVHFSFTYAACLLVGFAPDEALEVASADQRIDENDSTVASVAVAFDGNSSEAKKRQRWHALDDSRDNVLKQLAFLSERAAQSKSLVEFGQYLHFLQDHFSHREKKGKDWKPYGWKVGHAVRAHQPDRVADDRELAEQMATATLEALGGFLSSTLLRPPHPLDPRAAKTLVNCLAASYGKDALGYWNEADSYKCAIQLEAGLLELGMGQGHVPHVSRIIKMKFDSEGGRTDTAVGSS